MDDSIDSRLQAWSRAHTVPGLDPRHWRMDAAGRMMYWGHYGRPEAAVLSVGRYPWELAEAAATPHHGNGAVCAAHIRTVDEAAERSAGTPSPIVDATAGRSPLATLPAHRQW